MDGDYHPLKFCTGRIIWRFCSLGAIRVLTGDSGFGKDLCRHDPQRASASLAVHRVFGLAELGLKLSPLQSAIVTFSVIASAYLGEIYRGGLASLGSGQIEAAQSIGLSRFDLLARIISPQIFRTVSPSMVTYGIGLMKDSALASTIGVVEMTFRANQVTQSTGMGLTSFAIVGGIYLALSIPLGLWARRVDEKMRKKYVVN